MQNYTKRKLMELLEKLPEDSMISFVAAHSMEEGDLFIPLGEYDPDHPSSDCFYISAGDPDEVDLQLEWDRGFGESAPLFRPETRSTL